MAFFQRFIRNDDGAVAVEFALVSGFLIAALLGILELGMIYFVTSTMEGAVRDAARYGTTGQTPATGTRADQIVAIANKHTLNMLNLTSGNVTTKIYRNFASIGLAEPLPPLPPK